MKKIIETNLIIEFLIRKGIDIDSFCKMCNIKKKIFSDIMMQNINFDVLWSLQNIVKVTGISFERLYGINNNF